MANAYFRFYEELNDFLPPERRKMAFVHTFNRRASVKDMIESLGVPHPEIELIVANGASVDFDYIVGDGDRIAVYPVFEAFDIRPELAVRREPLRALRFVLDGHLGTLARYLRLCGFDSAYRNDIDDDELAETSATQGRILLTRDRDALKRRIVTHGYWIRQHEPRAQLAEIFRRFDLYDAAAPFTRCAHCNSRLEDVTKAAIEHRLEPLTRIYYDRFRRCLGCGRLYWRGTHAQAMQRLIDEVRTEAGR